MRALKPVSGVVGPLGARSALYGCWVLHRKVGRSTSGRNWLAPMHEADVLAASLAVSATRLVVELGRGVQVNALSG